MHACHPPATCPPMPHRLPAEAGAPWHSQDRQGHTAGEYASGSGRREVVRQLLDWAVKAELILGGCAARREGSGWRRAGCSAWQRGPRSNWDKSQHCLRSMRGGRIQMRINEQLASGPEASAAVARLGDLSPPLLPGPLPHPPHPPRVHTLRPPPPSLQARSAGGRAGGRCPTATTSAAASSTRAADWWMSRVRPPSLWPLAPWPLHSGSRTRTLGPALWARLLSAVAAGACASLQHHPLNLPAPCRPSLQGRA